MTVLEAIAEKHLGASVLKKHPHLRQALRAGGVDVQDAEKDRIVSIVALCFEYDRETDAALRTQLNVSLSPNSRRPTVAKQVFELPQLDWPSIAEIIASEEKLERRRSRKPQPSILRRFISSTRQPAFITSICWRPVLRWFPAGSGCRDLCFVPATSGLRMARRRMPSRRH